MVVTVVVLAGLLEKAPRGLGSFGSASFLGLFLLFQTNDCSFVLVPALVGSENYG